MPPENSADPAALRSLSPVPECRGPNVSGVRGLPCPQEAQATGPV